MNTRQFLGVWIPAEIWEEKTLSIQEKILLMEITYLDGEQGCFATNKYLSEAFIGLHEVNISQYVTRLKNKGFIKVESFDGRNRVLRSNIKKYISSPLSMLSEPAKHQDKKLSEITNADLVKPLTPTLLLNNIEKNNIYATPSEKEKIEKIFSAYKSKIQSKCRLTPLAVNALRKALKNFTEEELLKGIDNFSQSYWWMKHNGRKGPVWYFGTLKLLEQYIDLVPDKQGGVRVLTK